MDDNKSRIDILINEDMKKDLKVKLIQDTCPSTITGFLINQIDKYLKKDKN